MAKGRGDTVEKLFSPKRQYEIPIYQRRYVWGIENWEALWTDIQEKFDRRLKGEHPTSHFTGIIITRKNEKGQGLPKYQILDGQQRLTTFQILLCVIRDLCKSKNYTLRADSADLLIKNDGYKEKYKLCPKEGFDEKAFRALVDSEPRENHVIHRAYNHFMDAITNDIGMDHTKIDHLYNAVTIDFHMDQIDLKKGDEPEKIFASLNATGRMLDEFDHLRNDLFLRAGEAGNDLYDSCWSHFDIDSYWEDPENLDRFLKHFLQATVNPECFQKHEGKEVKAFDVYLKQYRSELEPNKDIEYEFRKLKKYSRVYQEMNDPNSKIGSRMRFYKEFEIDSLHPFILYIISEFSQFANSEDKPESKPLLSDPDLELIFDILESYMMRRILRWGGEDRYKVVNRINDFFYKMRKEKCFSLIDFLNYLAKSGSGRHADQWPTNQEVEFALTERWYVEKGIRYILYRIELKRRNEEKISEKIDFIGKLHYIMPEKWENSWLLEGPDGPIQFRDLFSDEYKAETRSWFDRPSQQGIVDESYLKAFTLAQDRKNRRKSIGNLTLVDEVSEQTKFDEKEQYFANSKYIISNDIVNDYKNWDTPQIDDRAEKLIKYFHEIWKYSNHFRKEYLSKKYSQGSIVRGPIVNITKKGLYLRLEAEIEGRIAMSEIIWAKRSDPSKFKVGDEIEAVVLEISYGHRQVPLSLEQLQPNPWQDFEQKYSVGMEITGYINKLNSSRASVTIEEGIEGRISNVNLSWTDPRATVKKFFSKGDKVEAVILDIDTSKQLISLGFKQLQPNPWDDVSEKYKIGSVTRGRIVKLKDFGAFVEIEEGIDGLVHISELTDQEIEKPEDIVSVGDELDMKIIHVSSEDQQIRLSLKAMNTDEAKNQPRWISLIESQTIWFITNEGRKQLSNVEVRESNVIGLNIHKKESTFNIKQDVLFAYSDGAHPKLLYEIPKRMSPQELITEQLGIDDITLKSAQENRSVVKAIVRSGHELKGIIEGIDKDVIYMQINEQTVIVFRHSICDFKSE